MQTFQHLVKDPDGLHARPAGLLVKCAQGCSSDIQIAGNDKTVDAKRLFAVMGLCVKQNDNITFRIEGENEQDDRSRLEAFCRENI
jgi:phosphocarrier protein HPr